MSRRLAGGVVTKLRQLSEPSVTSQMAYFLDPAEEVVSKFVSTGLKIVITGDFPASELELCLFSDFVFVPLVV